MENINFLNIRSPVKLFSHKDPDTLRKQLLIISSSTLPPSKKILLVQGFIQLLKSREQELKVANLSSSATSLKIKSLRKAMCSEYSRATQLYSRAIRGEADQKELAKQIERIDQKISEADSLIAEKGPILLRAKIIQTIVNSQG